MHEPTPLPTAKFRVYSQDPTFTVAWRGGARFRLSGEVSGEPSSRLELTTPSSEVLIDLEHRSRPEHAVALLGRTLPRDILMTQTARTDGIEVSFQEAVVPAARPPRFRIISTDGRQRVMQLRDNCVAFAGATGTDAQLTLLCDRRRVTLIVGRGTSAEHTAARVGANVPHGYRALVDGPTVAVWKDADFFEQVA